MSNEITAALLFLRDELKRQAEDILKPAEEKLKLAKQEYHDAKILHNQLMKRSQKIQSLITIQMQKEYDEAVEAEEAWEVKGTSDLMELIKEAK